MNKSSGCHKGISIDDLELDLENYLKVNIEFLNGYPFLIWKGWKILCSNTLSCQ